MINVSPWKTTTLAYATDDDLTPEVNLEANYKFLTVLFPAMESSTLTVHVSDVPGGTFIPVHAFDDDATGSFAHATSASTGSIAYTFRIGGVQFIKISCGTGQTANRVIKVRGFN